MSEPKDARRVRFESIDGIGRQDVGLAGEIWLRDVCDAKWVTREAMKLAAFLVRYMAAPDPRLLALSRIEQASQLTKDELNFALKAMTLYRAVEAYSLDGGELSVAMRLSMLQRLEVLEVRDRLAQLSRAGRVEGESWRPAGAAAEDEAAAA